MSSNNLGGSVLVRALEELPEEQRAVYSARYIIDEEREATCRRLGMAPERYDQLLAETLRSLRRMVSFAPGRLAEA
jgi:DNA-directed RNA polymerase sigma subunit (sigma70/sigma32)